MFLLEMAHFDHEQLCDISRAFDLKSLRLLSQEQSATDLDRRLECGGLSLANPMRLHNSW